MPLNAISPLDGRYKGQTAALAPYFSEAALIKFRVQVEVAWLQALSDSVAIPEVRAFTLEERAVLQAIVAEFDEGAAAAVKQIERTTNHDVKAVEYYVKGRLAESTLA